MLCSPARLAGGRQRQRKKGVIDSMTGAMYAAIGGLKTHMSSLNVIGNNIANVNTAGYKDQRMTFQETIYTTSKAGSNGTLILGGNNPSQIGYGSQVGSIDLNMSPGTFNPTGRDLDCMIEGDGFFLVGDKDYNFNSGEDFTMPMLTRVGNFWQDAQGYICDRNGNVVYGFATVQNPFYSATQPAPAELETAAKAMGVNTTDELIVSSDLVPLRLPLAAQAPTVANGGLDRPDDENPKWKVGDPVYNLLGTADTTKNNSRKNYSLTDEEGKLKEGLTVTEEGLTGVPAGVGSVNGTEAAGGTNGPATTWADGTYTGPIPNEENKCITIDGLRITDTGAITGTCDNGQTVVIGYVAIAKVMAPDGVTHIGGPYYKCMEGAGDISVGAVGGIMSDRYLNNQITTGEAENAVAPNIKDSLSPCSGTEIQGGGLEASTADVATEFSNMILTQRGYQANTRIVTVTDSMLEELINMKR